MLTQKLKNIGSWFGNLFSCFFGMFRLTSCCVIEAIKGNKVIFLNDKSELLQKIGITSSKTLHINSSTNTVEINPIKVGANFTSRDIVNEGGKFVISTENDDEKTELYDIVTNFNITYENDSIKTTKIIRRLTLHRNTKGRLVNVLMGAPKFIADTISKNLTS